MTDDPLSEAELAFRALLSDRRAYAKWAAQVLKAWRARPDGLLACRRVEQMRREEG